MKKAEALLKKARKKYRGTEFTFDMTLKDQSVMMRLLWKKGGEVFYVQEWHEENNNEGIDACFRCFEAAVLNEKNVLKRHKT